jgi:hypothetical protein
LWAESLVYIPKEDSKDVPKHGARFRKFGGLSAGLVHLYHKKVILTTNNEHVGIATNT